MLCHRFTVVIALIVFVFIQTQHADEIEKEPELEDILESVRDLPNLPPGLIEQIEKELEAKKKNSLNEQSDVTEWVFRDGFVIYDKNYISESFAAPFNR